MQSRATLLQPLREQPGVGVGEALTVEVKSWLPLSEQSLLAWARVGVWSVGGGAVHFNYPQRKQVWVRGLF